MIGFWYTLKNLDPLVLDTITCGVLWFVLISILDWYIILVANVCSSRYSIWSMVFAYYGITYSTSSSSKSFSHSSGGWLYWSDTYCQVEPLSTNLISNLSYTSSWTRNTSSTLYISPYLQDNKFIYVYHILPIVDL